MLGFKGSQPNHIEWYISTMLFCMLIIYPILLKYYKIFTYVIAPILSLLLLGYLSYTTNSLTGVSVWLGFCYKSMLRSFVEISLGVIAFEVTKYVKKLHLNLKQKILLNCLEWFCIISTSIFVVLTFTKQYEVYVLFLIMIMIIIAFSKQTWYPKWLDNSVIRKIGKFTLPVYLSQVGALNIVNIFFADQSIIVQFLMYIILTAICALLCYGIGNCIINKKTEMK